MRRQKVSNYNVKIVRKLRFYLFEIALTFALYVFIYWIKLEFALTVKDKRSLFKSEKLQHLQALILLR